MSSVRIIADRGDGLSVEFDYDDGIMDRHGERTRELLERGVATVRASLRGSEPTENAKAAS